MRRSLLVGPGGQKRWCQETDFNAIRHMGDCPTARGTFVIACDNKCYRYYIQCTMVPNFECGAVGLLISACSSEEEDSLDLASEEDKDLDEVPTCLTYESVLLVRHSYSTKLTSYALIRFIALFSTASASSSSKFQE